MQLCYGGHRILDFDDESLVALMIKGHNNCLGRIMNIPKHQLAVIVKRPCGKEARHIRPDQFEAMPPTSHLVRIMGDVYDVGERDLQTIAECPHPVETFDLKNESIAFNRHIDDAVILYSP